MSQAVTPTREVFHPSDHLGPDILCCQVPRLGSRQKTPLSGPMLVAGDNQAAPPGRDRVGLATEDTTAHLRTTPGLLRLPLQPRSVAWQPSIECVGRQSFRGRLVCAPLAGMQQVWVLNPHSSTRCRRSGQGLRFASKAHKITWLSWIIGIKP